MAKITFMGAGSTVFAKNVLGDSLLADPLRDSQIALHDIDGDRLNDSKMMMDNLNRNINDGNATITAHLGVENIHMPATPQRIWRAIREAREQT